MTTWITIEGDKAITAMLKGVSENITKELSIVSWKTAKAGKTIAARQVVKHLAVKQGMVKKGITIRKRGKTGAELHMNNPRRIRLRHFGLRQNKQGVTFKVYKHRKRTLVKGAFQGPRPGLMFRRFHGMAFKRINMADPRSKLRALRDGPSVNQVVNKFKLIGPTKKELEARLEKEMIERIRWKSLKKLNPTI